MVIAFRPASKQTGGGIELSARVDERELLSILNELNDMPGMLKKAELAAVRKTTKTGKTRISKKFREEMGPGVLNKKKIDSRISLKFPSGQNLVGRIIISNRGFPLIDYRGRPKNPPRQEGITPARRRGRRKPTWTIHKSRGATTGRNHFVQRDRRGQVHIMVRTPGGRGGRNATAPEDYRIKYGPGLVSVARQFNFEDKMVIDLGDVLMKNVRNQVDRFLAKKNNKNA